MTRGCAFSLVDYQHPCPVVAFTNFFVRSLDKYLHSLITTLVSFPLDSAALLDCDFERPRAQFSGHLLLLPCSSSSAC